MDKDKLVQRLMATFLDELDEHARSLNRDLLALEKGPAEHERAELVQRLFRTVHSLKGAARSVDVHLIADTCHRLEEIFSIAQADVLPFNAALFSLLFATADAIDDAARRLRGQRDIGAGSLAELLPRLDAVVGRTDVTDGNGEAHDVAETAGRKDGGPQGRIGKSGHPESPTPGWTAPLTPGRRNAETAHATPPRSQESDPVAASASRCDDGGLGRETGPSASASPQQPGSHETPRNTSCASAVVRVPAEKLDRLLAQSSELLVARRRVAARPNELAVVRESVAAWKSEWRTATKAVRRTWSLARTPSSTLGDPRPKNNGDGQSATDNGRNSRRAESAFGRVEENLKRLEGELDRITAALASDERLLDQAANRLDDEVDRVRMLPFAEACQGLERTVRDLAQAGGKEVQVVIEGGAVELDRSILDGLRDPLLHLVRNAVDHGIERPNDRQAIGKSSKGTITITAALRGTQVEVVVADDGRGLDLPAIREQVRKKGFPEPTDDHELMRLIFLPGFSTAPIITDVSGRGVGLDVVKSRAESLLGVVDVAAETARGTRFTLSVPLTLTRLRVLLVKAGGQTVALAGTSVQKLVRISLDDLRSVEGREMFSLDGPPVLVASLAQTLGLSPREPARSDGPLSALVVAAGMQRVAFVVDEFIAEQEVVIKSLGTRVQRVKNVSGATLLPSGRVALVLNAASLVRTALSQAASRSVAPVTTRAEPAPKKRLLVVDDSITTRSLVQSILEAADYDVTVAPDGEAAWKLLQERGSDLVVSDVEMPRMDGFTLAQTIRSSKRFADLPVVLVTARESDDDKARGIEVGADAYLVKSAFDQRNLLETIGRLL